MKELCTSLLIIVNFSLYAKEFAPNCPLEHGENVAKKEECKNETKFVRDSILGLKEKYGVMTEKIYSFCLNKEANQNKTGLHCRTLSLFFNKNGDIIKDFFVDRFVGHLLESPWGKPDVQDGRIHTYTTYMIKRNNKTYQRYVDHIGDYALKVDQHHVFSEGEKKNLVMDTEVEVNYINGFPKYTALYFGFNFQLTYSHNYSLLIHADSVSENDQKKLRLLNDRVEKKYSGDFEEVNNLVSYFLKKGVFVRNYLNLNDVSVGTYKSDEDWNNFFIKEGVL